MKDSPRAKHPWLRFVLFVILVIILSIVGYLGYVIYPRFNLPSVTGTSLFILAAAAGLGSFFSPCSFPLLVTLLTRSIEPEENKQGTFTDALFYGLALSIGATLFLLLTGAIITFGGGFLIKRITFTSLVGRIIRIVIGIFLIGLGLIQSGAINMHFDLFSEWVKSIEKAQAKLRRQHPILGFGLFGFGYILAGFG